MESFTFNLVIDGPADQLKDFYDATAQASTLAGGMLQFKYAPWTASTPPIGDWTADFCTATLYAAIRHGISHLVASAEIVGQTPLRPTMDGKAAITYELDVVSVPLYELEETSRLHPDLTFTATWTAPFAPPMKSQWIAGDWTMERTDTDPAGAQ
ncbi:MULTISPECIES: hypothetical protein [Aeromicrobium]|uniref:Uncharacterized protein n=1 Tax=Aeromicrobium fastidiosum TaxID=52699 RepID=A0A641AM18_9ACTN|nr:MULTISPECIES: hypothetical protein [Aeromicrobium]KAA1378163.1 hypothetical protein ESP62_007220 [Aeromicrobium fastidiosum]MBD8607939.1 hypothetical protein [Aeromicrobium sp. CFBP 8757]MBP2389032.1 hypothetical protein [Aeromicrobium fastidiosum]